jgi:hypothetical protein
MRKLPTMVVGDREPRSTAVMYRSLRCKGGADNVQRGKVPFIGART